MNGSFPFEEVSPWYPGQSLPLPVGPKPESKIVTGLKKMMGETPPPPPTPTPTPTPDGQQPGETTNVVNTFIENLKLQYWELAQQQQYLRMRMHLWEIPEAQAKDELGRHNLATQAVFQFSQQHGRIVPYAVLESLFLRIPGMGRLGETTMAKKTPGQPGGGKSVEQMFQELKKAGWPPAYEDERPSDAEIIAAYQRTAV